MNGHDDSSQRWQKIAIEQLGHSVNLFLTFSVAALTLWFALLRDKDFLPSSSAKCMMILSLVFLTVAALSGCACTLNRLYDFRGTAARARGYDTPSKEFQTFAVR